VHSRNPNALPLIMTHGWPGSVFEELKVIGPLTDPVANGGRAEDSFDLVLPSMPGYGFSGKPVNTQWTPDHIARAWEELMRRLGYQHYVAQGGDWGSVIADKMAAQKPPGLLGIHVNMPATVPPAIAKSLQAGSPPPAARRTLRQGTGRVQVARQSLHARRRIRRHDGHATADDRLCARRLACGTSCMDVR
jgi:pimeloyl-ACP methyl ester carboxylesterase